MRNKKFSLAELAEAMTVVSLEEQKLYYGGYDDKDCVWRCLAYINSNGQDYGAEAVMKLAQAYYGTSFDENNYEFKGSMAELSNFTKDFFSDNSGSATRVLVFDPNDVPGWTGDGYSMHAVIIEKFTLDYFEVFDPQTGAHSKIKRSYLEGDGGSGRGYILKVNNRKHSAYGY